MCTVTWQRPRSAQGLSEGPGEGPDYSVFFNRDERRTRAPALPPREQLHNGVRYVCPIDGEAGGTWLAASERGLTLALLNYYEAALTFQAARPISRGLLVLSLIDAADADAVTARLRTEALARYHPFILLAFDAATTRSHRWDGTGLLVSDLTEDAMPLSTSGYDTERVLAYRRALLRRLRLSREEPGPGPGFDAELLRAFHDAHDPAVASLSVCMTRPDAQTVSFSRVTVRPDRVELRYEPRDGGRPSGAATTVCLTR